MTLVSQAEIVVVDTSVVVNFAKTGALRPFADYLGSRVVITQDVFDELQDWVSTYPTIGGLLLQRPWSQPIELSPALSQKVLDILGFVEGADAKARLQDVGEVSSVVLAQDLRDSEQRQPILLLDDIRHGKQLARVRGLEVVDTPSLIIEMVHAGVASRQLGKKMWQATFSDKSKWASYESRLAETEQ
jgi:predicted nucleic acid-binding protein